MDQKCPATKAGTQRTQCCCRGITEPSQFGISVRQAIGVVAGAKYAEGIDFDWGLGVEACPVSDIEGVDDLRDISSKQDCLKISGLSIKKFFSRSRR